MESILVEDAGIAPEHAVLVTEVLGVTDYSSVGAPAPVGPRAPARDRHPTRGETGWQ